MIINKMEPNNNFNLSENIPINSNEQLEFDKQKPLDLNKNESIILHSSKISNIKGILVKQRMNMMEVITGCEMENIFDIFEKHHSQNKIQGKRLWRAIEESTCIQRNCVQQSCRSFQLKILNVQGNSNENDSICLRMERPCTCSFLCLNRPFISMNYLENGENIYLGKISDPYDFTKTKFIVRNKYDNPIYKVETCCVQCGIICKGCACSPCQKVSFEITDMKSGHLVSSISKINNTCWKDLVSDSDNFAMDFPENISWEDKSLLLGTILFVDYMMFEEKGGI